MEALHKKYTTRQDRLTPIHQIKAGDFLLEDAIKMGIDMQIEIK